MRNPITTLSIFICFIICNNLYASNVQIKGDVKSNGDIYISLERVIFTLLKNILKALSQRNI